MLLEICLELLNKCVCKHQFQSLQKKKKEFASSEAAIHIDFSENFICKHAEQVQSAHFGASHNQVSLHTGVLYTATDGPTTQYCNRRNLYLFISEIRETDVFKSYMEFYRGRTWQSDSRWGGGALKRKADSLVNMG